jgi:hypothetical protein
MGADETPKVLNQLVQPSLSLGQLLSDDPEGFKNVAPDAVGLDWTIELKFVEGGEEKYKHKLRLKSVEPSVRRVRAAPGKPFTLRRRTFDQETAAILKRLDPSPIGTKSERARYMQAKRFWEWAGKAHGLSISQRGRTPEIDPALVLYCYRILLDATGASKIAIGRPHGGGAIKTNDPLWRVLIEALPFAQRFLELRFGAPARRPQPKSGLKTSRKAHRYEAIAEILLTARSKHFEVACRKCGISAQPPPSTIASNAFSYRAAFYFARLKARDARAKTLPPCLLPRLRHGSF